MTNSKAGKVPFLTLKYFLNICRIAAIICSAIDFFLKNRDERLKSLIKYFRVCVNRHADQISK